MFEEENCDSRHPHPAPPMLPRQIDSADPVFWVPVHPPISDGSRGLSRLRTKRTTTHKTMRAIANCHQMLIIDTPLAVPGRSSGEQRLHKFPGIKRQQIARFFPYADKPDRQSQFTRNRHHHAAFGCAIELGQHDSCNSR